MKLTVLTPFYNRNEYIERMYKSLSSQSVKDFQWLVIDDGSKVSPEAEFNKLKETAPFELDYCRKENGGKHTVLNFSHPYIKGEWVLIMDSDDYLTPDAVETFMKYEKKYGDNKEVAVLSFLKGTENNISPVKYPGEETVSDHITFRINSGLNGDCCEVIRADVMREFPFPVFEGEKLLIETHLWMSVASKYKTVYINKVIYMFEYLEDGLTVAGHASRRNNPQGSMYTQKLGLNKRIKLKYRIKRAILLPYYGHLAGKSTGEILRYSEHPFLVGICLLPSFMLYLYEKRKY